MSDFEPYLENLYPDPGSQEFKDFLHSEYPKGENEKKADWLIRIGKERKITPKSRMAKLYGDKRPGNARFKPHEIQNLFHSAYPPRGNQVSSKLNRLEQAEIRDDQLNQIIGDKVNEISSIVLRRVAEGLLESLPRTAR